jgi:hydroxyethylthiazole kinase-like uncharacterized protein yjeF
LLSQVAWPYVGRLEVADKIGLLPCPHAGELTWTHPDDFVGFPPGRPVANHKGSFGHVGIVAGSIGYHGAGVLAARGAQRARPGLVTLLPHESAYSAAAAQLQAVMVQPWSAADHVSEKFSALLAGPGLAANACAKEMKKCIRKSWQDSPHPMIVDASALDWLPTGEFAPNAIRVITPHPGEAARLLQSTAADVQADRQRALRKLSAAFGNCWVVLKGHQSLMGRSEGGLFVNSSGNPFLAQGGAGDVLSGYLAGLLAQPTLQSDPATTIRFAVWQHGAAADQLQLTRPNWVVEDLVEALGL